MRILIAAALAATAMQAQTEFGPAAAERFAKLALDCVHKEYPNKIAHVMNVDADARPPRELTPAFYGCFDWHSSVHGHWLLARLLHMFPDASFSARARAVLGRSLTKENLAREAEYVAGSGRESFERPYGLAWLLQLAAELHGWSDPDAQRWSEALVPLEGAAVSRLSTWLPKLSYPVRSGEHSQTAFGLALMLDYARAVGNKPFAQLVEERIRTFYMKDRNCPVAWEPSGEDFLSPCLSEADAVRRVLTRDEFAKWFDAFMPAMPLRPEKVTDPADGKLAHLDGLNLSRAWMLGRIAETLGRDELKRAAAAHREAGLHAVTGEHYAGSHWLGTFAVYLVSMK